MATPETRTDRIETAGLLPAEQRKSPRRFITTRWWARRYRELSWAWRFNLIILILALLNSLVILIANPLGLVWVVVIGSAFYSAVVLAWVVGAIILIALSVKQFFAPPRNQPPPNAGSDTEQYQE